MQPKDFGYLTEPQFDFAGPTPCTRSYIIASSERSGSTYLATMLWATGLLGAPWEYLNYDSEMKFMARRLQPTSVDDYFRRVVALRTSANGVFGLKAHFHHFAKVLEQCPSFLDRLPSPRFVVIARRDRLGQAISLARAIQTGAWSSHAVVAREPAYDRGLIEQCLVKVKLQADGWTRWLADRAITPLGIDYEDLVAAPHTAFERVCAFIEPPMHGAADAIELPVVQRQRDDINVEWARRFREGV